MPSERQYRREIALFGRALHERGYVAAMDGNLSVRLDERHILATPTSMCKGMMKPSDMVIVDMDGRRVEGRRDVSSEIAMHLLIYKLRPDVQGVVHAHPPTATGFAAAGMPLNQPLVPQYDAILMSNHGVVACGADLHHAYMKMETVEHFAQIALITHLLGRQQPLGSQDLEKLMLVRSKYQGSKSAAPMPLAVPHKLPSGNNHDRPQAVS